MSQPIKISYGLSLSNKSAPSRPSTTAKRKPIFGGGDDDSDDDGGAFGRRPTKNKSKGEVALVEEAITELGDDLMMGGTLPPARDQREDRKKPTQRKGHLPPPSQSQSALPPPLNKHKAGASGDASQPTSDLASAFSARKHADAAEALDPSIYDYDASYDAFKAASSRKKGGGDGDGDGEARPKPQYMSNLRRMAEVRERDRRIAEDKKMQREREAEGDAFDDKEKFVTEAYKKQQEENRRLEEEERRREAAEAAKAAETGGMTGFYKQLLERDEARQAAIQEALQKGASENDKDAEKDRKDRKDRTDDESNDDADLEASSAAKAREINAHGGSVAVNDEGEVVDKRQLLRGGLNVSSRKRTELERERDRERRNRERDRDGGDGGRGGSGSGSGGRGQGYYAGASSKQSMRDRQSRMLAEQYEQTLKRTREEEDELVRAAEEAAKSRKTTSDISSAKERYLARKRAEAEAKLKEQEGQK